METFVDHSLVLKLINEKVKLDNIVAHMDKDDKTRRNLERVLGHIDAFLRGAGYDTIDLNGRTFDEGMTVEARFVDDESLPRGRRVITGQTRCQVNYNGKLIQPAEVIVSQHPTYPHPINPESIWNDRK